MLQLNQSCASNLLPNCSTWLLKKGECDFSETLKGRCLIICPEINFKLVTIFNSLKRNLFLKHHIYRYLLLLWNKHTYLQDKSTSPVLCNQSSYSALLYTSFSKRGKNFVFYSIIIHYYYYYYLIECNWRICEPEAAMGDITKESALNHVRPCSGYTD